MMKSTRVLVVDDFEAIRKIHINNLKKMEILNIDEAENGKDAVTAASSQDYDLIGMDWYMPEMTGYQALKIMRAQGYLKPILLCTDESDQNNIHMAKINGASDVIRKPYSPSQFRSTVLRLLGMNSNS